MKIFELRDERIIGDIRIIYLIARNVDCSEERFRSVCEYCHKKGINDISIISEMLISLHGFERFKVDKSHSIKGEIKDAYGEELKNMGYMLNEKSVKTPPKENRPKGTIEIDGFIFGR